MLKRRVIKICSITILTVIASYIAFRAFVEWATFYHPITAEARVLDKAGNAVFASMPAPRGEERAAIGYAVFWSSGLWPRHAIYSGDHTYAFAPFGRVFVLIPAGIDAYAVESRFHWTASPRDYAYPETPTENDWAARVVSEQRPHESRLINQAQYCP